MSDYYDYAPQVDLAKPIVLSGYLVRVTRALTRRAAALLGLPFHDIERLVEHEAGRDLRQLLSEEGEAPYRLIEARCLDRALRDTPVGLIALGDGGLLDRTNLGLVMRESRLVIVDFDLPNLYWRALRLSGESQTGDWHPLYDGRPTSVDALRPFYLERRAAFARSDLRIDASALSEAEACDQLIRWIRTFGT